MKKNNQKTTPQKRKEVRAGEIWVINDIRTRGHKSRITRSKDEVVEHIPITHSPETRRIKNIPLKSNPNPTSDPAQCALSLHPLHPEVGPLTAHPATATLALLLSLNMLVQSSLGLCACSSLSLKPAPDGWCSGTRDVLLDFASSWVSSLEVVLRV